MFFDCVDHTANPLRNIIDASVTMKAGSRNNVIRAPFNAPNPVPSASIASTPISVGTPWPSLDISFAPATLVSAMMDVTERSIPPMIITIVIPMATIKSGSK